MFISLNQTNSTAFSRKKSEQELRRVVEDTEKLVFEHTEELHKVSEYLVAEKERAEEYSTRILELEKELKLTGLSLKESQRALNTEKAVSSKFYDEVRKYPSVIMVQVSTLAITVIQSYWNTY